MSLIDPWLSASPDGIIYDPINPERIGIVEIKRPYKMREKTFAEACQMATFCLEDSKNKLALNVATTTTARSSANCTVQTTVGVT